jgi:hypothetical protein
MELRITDIYIISFRPHEIRGYRMCFTGQDYEGSNDRLMHKQKGGKDNELASKSQVII